MVSAIESVRVKDGGRFEQLSVQQVLDCAYKSQGCDGGSTVSTLDWLKQVLYINMLCKTIGPLPLIIIIQG